MGTTDIGIRGILAIQSNAAVPWIKEGLQYAARTNKSDNVLYADPDGVVAASRQRYHMKKQRSTTVRYQLVRLVVGCILPTLLMAAGLIFYDYRETRKQLERDSLATARALAAVVDKELSAVVTSLNVLATSPHIAAGEIDQLRVQASKVLRTNGGDSIMFDGLDGTHYFNTLYPFGKTGQQMLLGDLQAEMSLTGVPVISGVMHDNIRPIVAVGVPVEVEGIYLYSLTAGLYTERFAHILYGQNLPGNWIGAIFDAKGVIIARNKDNQATAGKLAAENARQQIMLGQEGVFEGVTLEGMPVLTVFSRAQVSNWSVVIGIPMADLEASLRERMFWLVVAMMCFLVFSLVVAWRSGNRIARSIFGLVRPAQALGASKPVVIPPLYLKEAEEVGDALVDASHMLLTAQHQASHDALTGLANRILFRQMANQQVAIASRTGKPFSVLYIDLDGFKGVNDTYGHGIGDLLLQEVARRLKKMMRESDIVARLGGDEFAVILVDADAEDAMQVGSKMIASISAPYLLDTVVVTTISASIGISAFPVSGTDVATLLERADTAMYAAKAQGKRRVVMSTDDMMYSPT